MKRILPVVLLSMLLLGSVSGCKSIAQRYIENVDINVQSVSMVPTDLLFGKLTLRAKLDIQNRNLFPLHIQDLTYAVRVGKETVVATGKSLNHKDKVIPKNGRQTIGVSLNVALNKTTYKAVQQVIKKKEKVKLKGVIQFGSPVGSFKSKFSSKL